MKRKVKTVTTLLKEAGLRLQDVADVMSYNRATIRGRKNNPEHFTVEELIILSRLTGKTPTAILKTILRELNAKAFIEEVE